ncbi:MAG: TonB-dependent receptor plug domain-containing protein [Microscillaceae bacterium]|nr:TonB-dependent receptor plug domain-containing protein [Microscillaceae bacterium]
MYIFKNYFCFSKFVFFQFFIILSFSTPVFPQTDSLPIRDLLRFKVEDMYQSEVDLLNKQVTIASKKSENLFDAPFATSVLTKEEIQNAGVTSIMEAFRLIPGLIVAEQTNGNFDIHLRGGSNVQRDAIFSIGGNTTTLVMIDNRPIYNYYLGGTFWETIPIDLNDVERIELVRGPTSAMYGPNAVSGVINIITRHPEEEGVFVVAHVQQGSNASFVNNASLGYKFNKKLSAWVTANWHQRNRNQDTYYNYGANSYLSSDSIQKLAGTEAYPDPDLAVKRYGLNGYLSFKPNSHIEVNVTGGYQDSRVQKSYTENFVTPLTTALSESKYVDVNARYNHLSTQFSFQDGTQSEGLGAAGQKWDFNTLDANVEYDFNIKKLNIKPGINYRTAIYDDTRFVDVDQRSGQFNARREITNFAAYLRGDYLVLEDNLRLIAAMRLDVFNFPKEPYFSYQLAANYKLSKNHLLRAVHARANRSANIIFTFADTFFPVFPLFLPNTVAVEVAGNQELDLLVSNLIELGYRGRLRDNLQVDAELFYARVKNYADFLYGPTRQEVINGTPTTVQSFETFNIPLQTSQVGITLSVNYVIKHFQIRPYFTYQRTTLKNSSIFNNTADAQFVPANPDPSQNNINSNNGTNTSHLGTPEFFGGLYLNYRVSNKFNINLNPYFFTDQQYYSFQNTFYPDGRGIGEIKTKFLLNAKFSLYPTSNFEIFARFKNLLDQKSSEFFNTDQIGFSMWAGVGFDF